jgi:hypothetical protein
MITRDLSDLQLCAMRKDLTGLERESERLLPDARAFVRIARMLAAKLAPI